MFKLLKKLFKVSGKKYKIVKLDVETLSIIADAALILADEECPENAHDSSWMDLANIANLISIGLEAEEYGKRQKDREDV